MKVLVRARADCDTQFWDSYTLEFEQLPRPGEFVALDSPDVCLLVHEVVHVPQSYQYAAEVYAEYSDCRRYLNEIPTPERSTNPFSEN